ncbi:MAG: type I DNA topoisomerase [bacterium]
MSQYLGMDFFVMACMGHVRDLPKSTLGIDVAGNFEPQYRISKERKDIVADLKEAAKSVDEVLLATDPDREGEAIAWHLAHILKNKVTRRIEFNEITKRAVKDALAHAREIDINKVDAQQARRVLDRLVGYSLSPYLWREIQGGLSAGRVQSVALRLVCEREGEIEKFVPVEYWSIEGLFKTEKGEDFSADLAKIDGNKIEIGSEDDAKKISAELKAAQYEVDDLKVIHKKKNPLPPFITSTLQQEASKRLKSPPRKAMRIAQKLYEGVKIGSQQVGLITYMRTDSFRIADEAIKDVRNYINKEHGKEFLPEMPNEYLSKKKIQDAHEAIRPTDVSRTPDSLKDALTKEEHALYDLIWRRFVASQMAPGEDKITTLIVTGDKYEFRTSRTVQTFEGYRKVWHDNNKSNNNRPDLPNVSPGDAVSLVDLKPEQHFTEPPPRYSSASLIKTLEELGIGRPSTYAPTISILLDRKYVIREKAAFIPTELGRKVDGLLLAKFPSILDYKFTANMEDELDQIQAGGIVWQDVIRQFYGPFFESMTKALNEDCPTCGKPLILQSGPFGSYLSCLSEQCEYKKNLGEKELDEECPECGKKLIEKLGRFGRFTGCTGYPKCKYIKKTLKKTADGEEQTETVYHDKPCPECGNKMLLRRSRVGGRFFGCGKYPDCRGILPFTIGFPCPKCKDEDREGELVERRSKKGKLFYSCSAYPDCDYVTFAHPLAGSGTKKEKGVSKGYAVAASEKPEDEDTES